MNDLVDCRVPRLRADDLDYLRRHARAHGQPNTAAAAVRFAVTHLADRLRREERLGGAEPDLAEPGDKVRGDQA